MRKKILFYLLILLLLISGFLFFEKADREIIRYAELVTHTVKVYSSYQNLQRHIDNAAVIHPELLKSYGGSKYVFLFFTDSNTVIHMMDSLSVIVKDSVNVKIVASLNALIQKELSWIIQSNVPDSIINKTAATHLASLGKIDSLVRAGLSRTGYLLKFHERKMDNAVTAQRAWMFIFAAIVIFTLGFTLIQLSKQQSLTRAKAGELDTVFGRINDAVISLDTKWKYTFLNDAALPTHPLGRANTLGKTIWEVHPHLEGTIFWEKYHQAMNTGKVVEVENFFSPMDTWFSVKVYPSANGLTIFYRDITEVKKIEQRLLHTLRELQDYKFALDEASIVAITDHKGRITYVNENFCTISKYSKEELIGQDHRIINSGYHPAEFIRNLWTTITAGKVWRGELRNRAKDGTIYWVDTYIVPFLNNDLKPYQYVAIRTDVTPKKQAELHLQRVNQSLQAHTRELSRSNAELEQFAYVASHDLQEPLRMVTGFLGQLQKKYSEQLDEKGNQYIHFAVDGAKRMRQIILDLLDFSRVGKMENSKTDVDTEELVHDIKSLFQKQLEEKKAILTTENLPVVHTYKTPLQQVLQNIISNALKYSVASRRPQIKVAASDLQTHWQFSITDNGIGISEEYFDKIFIIFQRLHNKDDYPGTGMGLAITKKIIDTLNGRIWLTSEEGKGSTFYFTIGKQDHN